MNVVELTDEALRLSRLLDGATTALRENAMELADAEHAYRKARARAHLEAPKGTVDEVKAWVDGHTADLRRARDYADHMRRAALEASRNRRQQVSAIQSVLTAHRAEAEFTRTGPQETP